MSVFVLATANRDKAKEIAEILDGVIDLVPRPSEIPDVEETGATLLDNARLKATAITAATGQPSLADDTGLEVDILDGAPGVYSARWAGPGASYADNVRKLLGELSGKEGGDRRARFRTVAVARWPEGTEVVAEGEVNGWIAPAARGHGGFGYDAVFVPDEGDGRTFAEMVDQEPGAKHRLSHRGRAFRALAEALAS